MSDWSPQHYLAFKNERNRPIFDLIAHIGMEAPERILDIGCGPGNSTAILEDRWNESEIIGLDISKSMVEKATTDHPEIKFMVRDASKNLSDLGAFDLVFANASLQWVPDHEALIPRLFDLVARNGIFAFQIPQFDRMPLSRAICEVERSNKWAQYFKGFKAGFQFYPDPLYYGLLCGPSDSIDMWATDYFHVMPSHEAILEMISSTGLRPYLEQLPEDKIADFRMDVLEQIKEEYHSQFDGKVLLPFKRLFVVATKS